MKPMWPGSGVAAAKLALRWTLGNDDPQAIGADDPHTRKLGLLAADLLFQLDPRRADLAEAGGNDHHAPRAGLAQRTHISGIVGEGVQITARSGTFGKLGTSLYAWIP